MSSQASASKPFECHCGTSFTRIENFKRHQRRHENKPYLACDVCRKTFSRPDMLQKHLKTHEKTSNESASTSMAARSVLDTITEREASSPIPLPLMSTFNPVGFPSASETLAAPSLDTLPNERLFGDGLSWDTGMEWILQDSGFLLDALWTGSSPSNHQPPLSAPLPFSVADTRFPTSLEGITAASRPGSPPVDINEEDKWPMNHRPGQTNRFSLGSGDVLAEVETDPIHLPELARYQRFWLGMETYEQVKSAVSLTPGPSLESFRLPRNLATVNTFISLFFLHFHRHLPVIHLPTFEVAQVPALLLAVIMAIGANYSGLRGARAFNVDMIDVIRRALAAVFEIDSLHMRNQYLILVALLNTLAGILSGHQRTFELAEVSRGLLIHLCRRAELLHSPLDPAAMYASMMSETADVRWRKWVMVEQGKRIGLAACLMDSFFPAFFDTPAYASQGEMLTTVLPSDEKFWAAENAQAWQALLGFAPIPPSPYFASAVSAILTPKYAVPPPQPIPNLNPFGALCVVNALHHHVYEYTAQIAVYNSIGLTVPNILPNTLKPSSQQVLLDPGSGFEGRRIWLGQSLEVWKNLYYSGSVGTLPDDPLLQAGQILYHVGHIALNVNIRDLYGIAGKFGPQKQVVARHELGMWSSTPEAQVAINHAVDLLGAMGFPTANNHIYSAPAGFLSILCLWAYMSTTAQGSIPAGDLLGRIGRGVKDANDLLSLGGKFLGHCRVWRIGPAYMLILAKMRM